MDALILLKQFANPITLSAYSKNPRVKSISLQFDKEDDVILVRLDDTAEIRFHYILKETTKGSKYVLAKNDSGNREIYLSLFGPQNLTKTPKKKKASMCAELCSRIGNLPFSSTLFMYKN